MVARIREFKIFYGWWIVGACFLLFFWGGGAFGYSFTAFVKPITDEFGWSRTAISVAFSLQSLEGGLVAPLAGFLIDRLGPRRVILFGVGMMGLGVFLISHTNSLLGFYSSFLITAMGFGAGFGVVAYAAVGNWFVKKRARAMGLLAAGYGASGILTPAVVWLIGQEGWRTTLVIIALGTLIVGVPLAMVVRHRPEQYGLLPDGETPTRPSSKPVLEASEVTAPSAVEMAATQGGHHEVAGFTTREALRTQAFWLLMLGAVLAGVGPMALLPHIIPYLTGVGISPEIAALSVTGITLCSLIGRLGFGWLGDYIDKRLLIAIAAVFQALGIFILAYVRSPWMIIPFVFTFGPGYAGPIPIRPALQADYYGMRAFGLIQGLMFSSWMVAGLFGPLFAGWVFDVTGSYYWAFLITAFITLLSVPIALAIRPPRPRE